MNESLSDVQAMQFKAYLAAEEKSSTTISKYLRDIRLFRQFIGEAALSKEIVIAYKEYLLKHYKVSSVNSMLASINALFSYLNLHELRVKSMKLQRQVYCPESKELTKSEYFRLCRTAEEKNNLRLSLLLQTLCTTGIRISELPFITVEAVKKGVAMVSLKGKVRTVFIVRELQKKLLRYIAQQNIKKGMVFITKTGNPLDRSNIWREMKKLCADAKVSNEKVFPHNLRHLFARSFYDVEKDISKLADLLGHSSINTTRIYIIGTGKEHRRCVERMHLLI